MTPEPAKLLSEVGEDALVGHLCRMLPELGQDVVVGPGDDCAVVLGASGELQLLKTDVVVENVHFLRSADPVLIGRKALARAISDIAAMGGVPQHALITLVLPPDLAMDYVEKVYAGLSGVGREFGVDVVGGETSRGSQIVISVALTGGAPEGTVLRSGGRAGDVVWVTGTLGGSLHGHHFTFVPRIKESRWLMQNFKPTAMMDLSDGLGADLPRLAAASSTGWKLTASALPVTPGSDTQGAWSDGEDFELLFTTSADVAGDLAEAWTAAFPDVKLTAIGHLTEKVLPEEALLGGWDHFRKGALP